MKNVIIGILVVLLAGTLGYGVLKENKNLRGGQGVNATNFLNVLSQDGTTTNANLPVLVTSRSFTRQYLTITNDCRATAYLFFTNFASGILASTTVTTQTSTLGGLPLFASSSFSFNSNNLYPGDVWAATSSVPCKLNATYYQP